MFRKIACWTIQVRFSQFSIAALRRIAVKSIREVSIFALLIFVCSTLCAADPGKDKSGSAITGRIIDAQTGEPLIGATIMLENKFGGTKSNLDGEYLIKGLSPGKYTLQVSNIGYVRLLTEDIKVSENEPTIVNIRLSQKPIALKDITVTPGRFRIMGKAPAAKQSLTRGQIETRPQLGEDLYRAIERLPGVSSTDFSARFNVRGGEYDEVMVTIDGLQIYEPFHLKDIDGGVMSIIDVATVDGVDLMTGGFPAVYGDKMSGVFNISSKKPSEDGNRLSLGLSLMNVRALSEGTFNNGKSSWLVSARRGYIDWVLKLSGADDEINNSLEGEFPTPESDVPDGQEGEATQIADADLRSHNLEDVGEYLDADFFSLTAGDDGQNLLVGCLRQAYDNLINLVSIN